MKKIKRVFTFIIILAVLTCGLYVAAYANGETVTGGEREASFYELIYSAVSENSEKIMSALAAIASLVLAFTYKKGLLPTLKSAIDKLCDAVAKIKNESALQSEKAQSLIGDAADRLNAAKTAMDDITERLDALERELSESLETKDEKEKFRLILLAQTEMLYDIFMSSALPQYQKDIVGEKTAKIKEQINSGK